MLRVGRELRLGFFTEKQLRDNFINLEKHAQEYGDMGDASVVLPKLV
jgi:hypothetical protein